MRTLATRVGASREPAHRVGNGPVLLDLDHLQGLREIGGSDAEAFIQQLVEAFESEAAEELEQIRSAVADGDATGLVRAAHRLKGSALNLGCNAMADTAGELESLGRGGETAGANTLFDRLVLQFEGTLAELRIETAAA